MTTPVSSPDDLLGAQRDLRGLLARKGGDLVEGIGVQRVRAPRTAARASIAVRTTLLSGCWAVKETPAVCVWNRSHCARSVVAPYRSRKPARPDPPGRPELGDLLEEVDVRVEEEASTRREAVHVQALTARKFHVTESVGEGEGQPARQSDPPLADAVA